MSPSLTTGVSGKYNYHLAKSKNKSDPEVLVVVCVKEYCTKLLSVHYSPFNSNLIEISTKNKIACLELYNLSLYWEADLPFQRPFRTACQVPSLPHRERRDQGYVIY